MINKNLEQRVIKQNKLNALGDGMIYLMMGGFGGAGTKISAEILGKTSSSSNPIVFYGDGSLAAAATVGCGALAVYCGFKAVKAFQKAIKYNNKIGDKGN